MVGVVSSGSCVIVVVSSGGCVVGIVASGGCEVGVVSSGGCEVGVVSVGGSVVGVVLTASVSTRSYKNVSSLRASAASELPSRLNAPIFLYIYLAFLNGRCSDQSKRAISRLYIILNTHAHANIPCRCARSQ